MIAHVKAWTAAKEYDQNRYDLYPLGNARRLIVPLKVDGEEQMNQDWYVNFGKPTKEAMKDGRGELLVRQLVVDNFLRKLIGQTDKNQ